MINKKKDLSISETSIPLSSPTIERIKDHLSSNLFVDQGGRSIVFGIVKFFSLYDVVWFLVNLIFTTVIASAVVVDDYTTTYGYPYNNIYGLPSLLYDIYYIDLVLNHYIPIHPTRYHNLYLQ